MDGNYSDFSDEDEPDEGGESKSHLESDPSQDEAVKILDSGTLHGLKRQQVK